MTNLDILKTHHSLVLCEGTAEEVIFNKLYEAGELVIESGMLHDVTRTRGARRIQEEYLNFHFDYPVYVVRLVDSVKERFALTKLYSQRYPVLSFFTRPEIEMLVIIAEGQAAAFRRKGGSNLKPSDYCVQVLKYQNIKSRTFLDSYWDADKLIQAIVEYKRIMNISKDEFCLADLLKEPRAALTRFQ
ncbi:MAG: hypothetical protein IJ125_02565 [Atopobiaceae bacterium]|nr:hypothetical protein [Atopobiaceae bacterium]